MKDWIKRKLGITALEKENEMLRIALKNHRKFVQNKVSELKDYTRVDADVGARGNNTIVLTGVYKKNAFVRFYDIGDGQFEQLVNQMRSMKDHCLIRNIDMPPQFKGMFEI